MRVAVGDNTRHSSSGHSNNGGVALRSSCCCCCRCQLRLCARSNNKIQHHQHVMDAAPREAKHIIKHSSSGRFGRFATTSEQLDTQVGGVCHQRAADARLALLRYGGGAGRPKRPPVAAGVPGAAALVHVVAAAGGRGLHLYYIYIESVCWKTSNSRSSTTESSSR